MAIKINTTYSGRTDNTDPNYPYGKGRNVVGGVEGTGTPFEAQWYNNLEGFLQGLLLEAGITPDGQVDNANSSQLVEAVKGIAREGVDVLRQDLANPDKGAGMVARGVVAVDSIADLLALPEGQLKEGLRYSTAGYHSKGDGGGALYFISSTDPGYGIPLPDGRFAVFCDTFDIRKFGVVSNPTLDQSVNLQRMINYADTRVYEIDFLNYKIKNPKIMLRTTGRGSVIRGLLFKQLHKLKNLFLVNDKTVPLYQGTCGIVVAPSANPDTVSKMIFENITLDMYVANPTLISGESDGFLNGIHIDPTPTGSINIKNNIALEFKDVMFSSSAQSYNISASGEKYHSITVDGGGGDHLMLYSFVLAEDIKFSNLRPNYRSDLFVAGRSAGRSVMHLEPESLNDVYISSIVMDNVQSSTTNNSTPYPLFYHRVNYSTGHVYIKSVKTDNCNGASVLWGRTKDKLTVDSIVVNNSKSSSFNTTGYVKSFRYENSEMVNSTLEPTLPLDGGNRDLFIIDNCDIVNALTVTGQEDATTICKKLIVKNSRIYDNTNGLLRNGIIPKAIELYNNELFTTGRYIQTACTDILIDGLIISKESGESYYNVVYLMDESTIARISNVYCTRPVLTGDNIFLLGEAAKVSLSNSFFITRPNLSLANISSYTEVATVPPLTGSKTYDPPSLAASGTAGDLTTTTVSLTNANIGDNVNVAFSQYNASVDVTGQVSAANIVTVKFKNTGATNVDLASGTLTVKLI